MPGCCLALLLCLAWAAAAHAAVFTVTGNADVGDANTADGICATGTGACTLRAAVQQANALAGADTINLLADHYTLALAGADDAAVAGDLDILQPLTINGAGAASTTVDANNLDRVFDVPVAGTPVEISGVTITKGKRQFGSAIQSIGSSLTLTGVTVTGNAAGGGGMFGVGTIDFHPSGAGTITIASSTFSANHVGGGVSGSGFGGAIEFSSSGAGTLSIADSTFTDNSAGGDGSSAFGVGGAINFHPGSTGSATLTNSSFTNNTAGNGAASASGFGGGIEFSSSGAGTLNAAGTPFINNSAGGDGSSAFGVGGAINFHPGGAGTITLTNGELSDNTAGGGAGSASGFGGAIEFSSSGAGTLGASGTTLGDNTAGGGGTSAFGVGGAINFHPSTAGSELSMTNGTASGNSAGVGGGPGVSFGGAIEFEPSGAGNTLPLTNVTLADNEVGGGGATGLGGGLDVGSGQTATLKNTIVANNTASTGTNCNGPISSQGHNLESADTCTFNATGDLKNTDPKLDVLAGNGGSTTTRALLPGSPAIDAGDNSGCPATDQRGGARPEPPGGVCDIGAFEFGSLADLAISKTDTPDPVTAGQKLTYTLTATNNGPDQAAGVTVQDTLPAGSTFASASVGSCSGTKTVTCSLGTLSKAGSAKVTIQVTPTKAGSLSNSATVSGNPTDLVPGNNTATATTAVGASVQALSMDALSIRPRRFRARHSGPSITARVGATVEYTISRAASVTFTVERAARGRKVGRRCKALKHGKRKGRRCTRFVRLRGSFTHKGKAGRNKFRFTGRLRRKALHPRRYRLVAVASAAGAKSAPRRANFRIVR